MGGGKSRVKRGQAGLSSACAGALVREIARRLGEAGAASPATEAEWLVAWACGLRSALDVWLAPERKLDAGELGRLDEAVCRRVGGEPLQYITGGVNFRGLALRVGPGVLIPRPETELLVEVALELGGESGWLCDLCTGSGAVALALAREAPGISGVIGVDISRRALAYAAVNARASGLADRVGWLAGDLLEPVRPGPRFAGITANPPYVSAAEYAELPGEIRNHEPAEALLGGTDGLDLIRRIAAAAPDYLAPGGWIACEIGAAQGEAARALFGDCGFRRVGLRRDYAGRDRIVVARV